MHVFTHSFDYIALGVLIACMLLAAAKVLPYVTHSQVAGIGAQKFELDQCLAEWFRQLFNGGRTSALDGH